jgi:hypothetical protein
MDSNVSGAVSLTSMSRLKDIPGGYASVMMVEEGVEIQRLKSEKGIRGEGSLSAQNNSKKSYELCSKRPNDLDKRESTPTGAGSHGEFALVCLGLKTRRNWRRCLSATLQCGVEHRTLMTSSLGHRPRMYCIKSETC